MRSFFFFQETTTYHRKNKYASIFPSMAESYIAISTAFGIVKIPLQKHTEKTDTVYLLT